MKEEVEDINNVYMGRGLLWPQTNWGKCLFFIGVGILFRFFKKALMYFLSENTFVVFALFLVGLFVFNFFMNFMYRKTYLAVDEEKNLIYYSLKNNRVDIIAAWRINDIASIKENVFLGKIELVYFDNSTVTLSENPDNILSIKIKTLLLSNYPEKVPMEWHNDEKIHKYISERKLPPASWMQVLKLFTIVVLVLFFVAIFVVAVLLHFNLL